MRRSMMALAGLLAACANTQKPTDMQNTANLVLTGGTIRTLHSSQPVAQALAIKDGRIVAVGTETEIASWVGEKTQLYELNGRTVVPGFVDSHMHLLGLGRKEMELDLSGTASIEEVAAIVRAAAENTTKGRWITGRGWDQNDWPKREFPNTQPLDEAAPHHPVILRRIDGHAAWVNQRALDLAEIRNTSLAPEGGAIIKDTEQNPTGILIDNAIDIVTAHLKKPDAKTLEEMALLGQKRCLEAGLTQVHDMGLDAAGIAALERIDARGELKIRVYGMIEGSAPEFERLISNGPQTPGVDDDRRLTLRGVKLYADGALGSRGAALIQPYADDPKNSGLMLSSRRSLKTMAEAAAEQGFQVAIHAIGDRGNREVLDIYAEIFGAGDDARPRVEHAQVVALEDIPRFQKLGVIASVQPTHATSDMPWAEDRLGDQRIQGAYAWRRFLDAKTKVASGSDAPVERISVLEGIYAATTRKDRSGQPEEGWFSDQRLSPEEALHSFTQAGAYASFREKIAGQLRPGWAADLTVLDVDPLEATPHEILKGRVLMTVVGGEIAFAH